MQIIPAIDLINGACVRLTKGDFNQSKVYNANPVEVAKQFEAVGVQRLHLVDLDGSKQQKIAHLPILEAIAKQTKLSVDFGGGITSLADVQSVLNAGASMATIGSLCVKQPVLFAQMVSELGADKFFIAADVLHEKIKINGWLQDADTDIYTFLQNMMQLGLQNFFCTDIDKDGAMQGPSTDLYKKIIGQFNQIQLTASGGVTSVQHLHQLKAIGCKGAIVGKAIYEGHIKLEEISEFL